MKEQASSADELYVLGDLFEVWIGDDAIDEMAKGVISAFNQFSHNGGQLFFCHGNRDFLLGSEFIEATGGTLLREPHSLKLAKQNALLMHGDSLCTLDTDYMAFRDQVRNLHWQEEFLLKPINERQIIANQIRQESMSKGQSNNSEIMDVTESEVISLMTNTHSTLLIHGHTHRQDRHPMIINSQSAERIVLGDWGETGSVLSIKDNQIDLSNFS